MVCILNLINLSESSLTDFLDDLILPYLLLAALLYAVGPHEGSSKFLNFAVVLTEDALEQLVAGHAVGLFIKGVVVEFSAVDALGLVETLLEGGKHSCAVAIAQNELFGSA